MTMSNYPPGVTGNEPQIAGYDGCDECLCADPREPWSYSPDEDGNLLTACEHTGPCDCDTCDCGCHSNGDDVDEFTEPDLVDDGYDYDAGW